MSTLTENDVARFYAELVQANHMNWGVINRLIVDRWSLSGLLRIKRMAWKIVNEQDDKRADSVPSRSRSQKEEGK